jgi:hypothetical protein
MVRIKKGGVILFILLGFYSAQAQRLNTGFNMDFYGINITRFPSDIIFSETTYKAYYIKKLQAPSGMQTNYGLNILVDYSRFFFNARVNLSAPIDGMRYKYTYPIGGNQFTDYYSKIYCQQAAITGSFGYFFSPQQFFKPYLEVGIGRASPYFYQEDFSYDKSFKKLWSNHNEIKEYMGLYKPYNFLVLGLGYRGDMFSVYTRYNIRMGNYDVYFSSLSFGMAIYTKFSKLRKHYIFEPKE